MESSIGQADATPVRSGITALCVKCGKQARYAPHNGMSYKCSCGCHT